MLSALGIMSEATSAVIVTVSLAALPSVVFPLTVKFAVKVVLPVTPNVPPTVAFPIIPALASTSNVSIWAVPSKYKSLNSNELVPKSTSLSVTGIIAPSAMYNCCTGLLLTST